MLEKMRKEWRMSERRHGMTRRELLGVAAVAAAGRSVGVGAPRNGTPGKPNLILLLADDMGYADASCFGSKAVQTPNLDALAAAGMRFTQYYAASAVCTPTRASVLTGRYPLRFDIRKHFSDDESHLPRDTVTLPKLLQQAGYATAHMGKWHLGGLHVEHAANRAASIPGPHEHGFDHYQCQIEQPPLRGKMIKEKRLYREGGTCLLRDDRRVPPTDPEYRKHLTDINGDAAVRYIEQFHKQGKPFFLNVWFLVPHTPYEPAPDPHLSRYQSGAKGNQLSWRSMMSHMDAKIGQIVAKLRELGIERDTFILFASDNGAAWEGDIGPLKGGKTDLHEGGIRVPMIATWPGRIPPGTTSDTLAHSNDILPTFCAAAGAPLPSAVTFDGLSLLEHLTEGKAISDEQRGTVFWQLNLYRGLQRHSPKPKPYATEIARRGTWKLLCLNGRPVELFDVTADIGERRNLLSAHPKIAADLAAEVKAWLAEPRKSWTTDPHYHARKGKK